MPPSKSAVPLSALYFSSYFFIWIKNNTFLNCIRLKSPRESEPSFLFPQQVLAGLWTVCQVPRINKNSSNEVHNVW